MVEDDPFDQRRGVGQRRRHPEEISERHRSDTVTSTVEDLAGDGKNRNTEFGRHGRHTADGLAVERLIVDETLPGHHQICSFDRAEQLKFFCHQLESRHETTPNRSKSPGEATSGTRPDESAHVDAEVIEIHLTQSFEATLEELDLSGRSSLLRTESRGRLDEGQPYITGDFDLDAVESGQRFHGPDRTEAAVGRRRATDADDDASRPGSHGLCNQFACAGSRGFERPIAVDPSCEFEAGGSCHLDDGEVRRHAPLRQHLITERTCDERLAVRTTKCVERALATVGNRNFGASPAHRRSSSGYRTGYLLTRGSTPELVRCCHDSHCIILTGRGSASNPGVARVPRAAILVEVKKRPTVIVSNRGPIAFGLDEAGTPVPTKSGGGLASALRPLLDTDALWIAASMSGADAAAARSGAVERLGVHFVELPADVYDNAYNRVANESLWFAHHGLLTEEPSDDSGWTTAWCDFETYNHEMANAVISLAPKDAAVLVQDYHLCLMAPLVLAERDDLRLVHFSHTPWAAPGELSLPGDAAKSVLRGMAAHHACGFHSSRWADAYVRSSEAAGLAAAPTFVSALGPDLEAVTSIAASSACNEELAELSTFAAGRSLVVRVDRIEPSKNILAGFAAFEHVLDTYPELRTQVAFAAYVYPSREALDTYRRLRNDIETICARINDRFGTVGPLPIKLDTTDNLPGAVAGMRRADALLINPLRDGLNLVAMEAPIVNEHNARLVLSTEAGAHDRLRYHCLSIDPADIAATASAIVEACAMDAVRAEQLAHGLRTEIRLRNPEQWRADQLAQAN